MRGARLSCSNASLLAYSLLIVGLVTDWRGLRHCCGGRTELFFHRLVDGFYGARIAWTNERYSMASLVAYIADADAVQKDLVLRRDDFISESVVADMRSQFDIANNLSHY